MADRVELPESLGDLGREFLKRANVRDHKAQRLLWSIVLLLAVGLLVVIFLPVGLSILDRFLTTGSLEDFIQKKQRDIASLEQELKEIDAERADLITRVNAELRLPGAVWISVGPDLAGTLLRIEALTSGWVLALGQTPDGKVLILRGSNDGQDWTPVGPDLAGNLLSIETLTSGTVLAVGRTGDDVLILCGSPASELLPADLDLPGINEFFQRHRVLPIAESDRRNVIALSTRKLRIDEQLLGLRVELEKFRDDAAQSVQGDPWTKQLYVQGTRLAFIAILIYLVQIYVNLYRYNMGFAAYYRARADALSILMIERATVSPEDFRTLVASLSPEGMDFGKAATPPTQ